MIPISAYFSEDLADKIKKRAEEQSRSISNEVVFIVKEYFKYIDTNGQKPKQPGEK